jgi:hypothetical protein
MRLVLRQPRAGPHLLGPWPPRSAVTGSRGAWGPLEPLAAARVSRTLQARPVQCQGVMEFGAVWRDMMGADLQEHRNSSGRPWPDVWLSFVSLAPWVRSRSSHTPRIARLEPAATAVPPRGERRTSVHGWASRIWCNAVAAASWTLGSGS